MARHREEARLGAACRVGLVAGLGQRALALGAVGDVAADALHFRRSPGVVADEALAPGDPARAERAGDLLVVHAGAVRLQRGVALFENFKREAGADQFVARLLREFAIGVVGVADAALGVAQHDQVALRFEQPARALLGLLQFPVPVGQRLIVERDLAHLLAHQAEPDAERGERDAGEREQERDADRKGVRVVAGILGAASGDESVGAAEHDREDHEGTQREGQPGMPAAETAKAKFDPESPSHRQNDPEIVVEPSRRVAVCLGQTMRRRHCKVLEALSALRPR